MLPLSSTLIPGVLPEEGLATLPLVCCACVSLKCPHMDRRLRAEQGARGAIKLTEVLADLTNIDDVKEEIVSQYT